MTYAKSVNDANLQLDLISTFSKDIRMKMGKDKCAYINIEKGKKVSLGNTFKMHETEMTELTQGENYTYLGQYAIPVTIPTFGILQWTKEEIEKIDVKTLKIPCLNGSFHVNSDVDRLYSHRNSGGRGLNNISDLYISRIISISRHLKEQANQNEFMSMVLDHEEEALVRVADGLINVLEIEITETSTPKELSEKSKIKIKKDHLDNWIKKPQHGFLMRTREQVRNIDDKYTNKYR